VAEICPNQPKAASISAVMVISPASMADLTMAKAAKTALTWPARRR